MGVPASVSPKNGALRIAEPQPVAPPSKVPQMHVGVSVHNQKSRSVAMGSTNRKQSSIDAIANIGTVNRQVHASVARRWPSIFRSCSSCGSQDAISEADMSEMLGPE